MKGSARQSQGSVAKADGKSDSDSDSDGNRKWEQADKDRGRVPECSR